MDAEKIGINYRKLPRFPQDVYGVGGKVDTYYLKNCKLIFGENAIIENLPYILVAKHHDFTKDNGLHLPSLLGLDVLRHYTIKFTDSKVILKRNSLPPDA